MNIRRKRLYLLMLLWLCLQTLSAQEMLVTDFKLSAGNITASTNPRLDSNGDACALLLVHCGDEITKVEGKYVGDIVNEGFEKRIYMSPGAKQIKLLFKNHIPLMIYFIDHNVKSLESKCTYVLTLAENTAGPTVNSGSQYLVMTVKPKNAVVLIDGNLQTLDSDGSLLVRLPYGEHSYKIEAQGYSSLSDVVTIGKEKVQFPISLTSLMSSVTVTCSTPQSHIYVNDMKRGINSWTGSLPAGTYMMEARKDGYRNSIQSVTLQERETRTVALPSLQAIVGSIDVSYRPANAEVYVDGTKVGTSPDIFRDIMVGSHRVEIRKSGYESAQLNVTVKENAVSDVTGSLKQSVVASSSSSTSGSSLGSYSSSSSSSSSTSSVLPIKVNGVTFNMIKVDGGTFTMGATSEQGSDAESNEKPAHSVTLSSYYIGETEVTQALWTAVMGSNPSRFKGDNKPVELVSWKDCQKFISRLNSLTGKTFSLPTEAQWEYSARGGSKSKGNKYSGSGDIGNVAWYTVNSYDKGSSSPDYGTHDVRTKSANELGLYDMSGNVWEWCSDWYGSYSSDSQTNPTGADSSSGRVYRGGSWYFNVWNCRVSYRYEDANGSRSSGIGLRLALVVL